MATLNLNNIPSGIDTVEKLHAWSGSILAQMLGGSLYKELPASVNDTGIRPVSSADSFTDALGGRRILFRCSITVDDAILSGGLPPYMYATEIAVGMPPAGFLEA